MGTVEFIIGSATVASTCGLIAATIGPAEIEVKADLEKPIWELGAHDVTLTHVKGPAVRVVKLWASFVGEDGSPVAGNSHRCSHNRQFLKERRQHFGIGDVIKIEIPRLRDRTQVPAGLRLEMAVRRSSYPTSPTSYSVNVVRFKVSTTN